MNPGSVREEFKSRVCQQIDLEPEGEGRFRVVTPFRFDDGDHFNVILKRDADRWILTDEANTLMHLSYWLEEKDMESGNRQEIIQGALSGFSVESKNGELVIPVSDERFGDALFNFLQALGKISDVSFLSRERVRSTFLEDFKAFFESRVPRERLAFSWVDPMHDPQGNYPVDCRINGMKRQLFVYALPSEGKVKDATINLLKFEQWGLPFQSIGIFEEQETIPPRDLARFTDVCEKTFSNLPGNIDRIEAHLNRILREGT